MAELSSAAMNTILRAAACNDLIAASSSIVRIVVQVREKERSTAVSGTPLTKGNGEASVSVGVVTFKIKNDESITRPSVTLGNRIEKTTGNIDVGETGKLTTDRKR